MFAALIAAAWLVSPAVELLHAEHAHRFCAEHLRIEEGDAASAGSDVGSDDRRVSAVPDAESSSHEACAFLAARRDELLPVVTAALLTAPDAAPVLAVAADTTGHLPVPVLARAPKSSPPLS